MNIAVIFAGGIGQRMKTTSRPKQFLEMHGKPIIIYTLEVFEKHPDIDAIVVACVADWIPYLEGLVDKYRITKVRSIVPGGDTGQMSIYSGLVEAEKISEGADSIVLIHDGVRPMIDSDTISLNIKCVIENGSAITCSKVTETVVLVSNSNYVADIVDRENSRVAKAPQSFWLNDIIAIHRKAQKDGLINSIDSCTLMRKYDYQLSYVEGRYDNIKITTPEDFYVMRAFLDSRENAQIYVDKDMLE